MELEL